jgi:hypothetical protein
MFPLLWLKRGKTRLTATIETEKSRLPLIKCKCGAEILLLPDLKAMDKAIQAHAQSHCKAERNPYRAAAEVIQVQDHLIAQMLRKAGSMNSEVLSF